MRNTQQDKSQHYGRRNRAAIRDRIAKREYALTLRSV